MNASPTRYEYATTERDGRAWLQLRELGRTVWSVDDTAFLNQLAIDLYAMGRAYQPAKGYEPTSLTGIELAAATAQLVREDRSILGAHVSDSGNITACRECLVRDLTTTPNEGWDDADGGTFGWATACTFGLAYLLDEATVGAGDACDSCGVLLRAQTDPTA